VKISPISIEFLHGENSFLVNFILYILHAIDIITYRTQTNCTFLTNNIYIVYDFYVFRSKLTIFREIQSQAKTRLL